MLLDFQFFSECHSSREGLYFNDYIKSGGKPDIDNSFPICATPLFLLFLGICKKKSFFFVSSSAFWVSLIIGVRSCIPSKCSFTSRRNYSWDYVVLTTTKNFFLLFKKLDLLFWPIFEGQYWTSEIFLSPQILIQLIHSLFMFISRRNDSDV